MQSNVLYRCDSAVHSIKVLTPIQGYQQLNLQDTLIHCVNNIRINAQIVCTGCKTHICIIGNHSKHELMRLDGVKQMLEALHLPLNLWKHI